MVRLIFNLHSFANQACVARLASFPGLQTIFSCMKDVEGLVSFLTCVMSRVERW